MAELIRNGLFATLMLTTISCMPEETPTPLTTEGEKQKSYDGFTGIVSAETTGSNKVRISWIPSLDEKVIAYNIYDTSLLFSPKLIRTVSAPAGFITLTNLLPQTLYSFRVRAANSKNIEDTNVKDLPAIPYGGVVSAEIISSSSARIHFSSAVDSDYISIYCKKGSEASYTLMRKSTAVANTSLVLTGLSSGETYMCRASVGVGRAEDNNSQTVTFTPIGQASELVFKNQPGNSAAGVNLPSQPVVQIMDANGNIVTAGPDSLTTIELSLSILSPTLGVIRGTSTATAVRGVATFSDINLQEMGGKIITARKGNTSAQEYGSPALAVDSTLFTIIPGTISAFTSTITATPVGPLVANGSSAYSVTIRLSDQYNNPISGIRPRFTSSNVNDAVSQPSMNSNSTGQSSGSITSTVAGNKTLAISSPSGLSNVSVSASFTPGPATKVAFTQQPINSPSGIGGLSQVMVAIQDAQGNTVNAGPASTESITLSIFVNPTGGTLSGNASVAAINGVATFSGLGIDRTGTGYRLVANAPPLSVAYSNAFNMTAGAPNRLNISGPPTVPSGACSTAYSVRLHDLGGNPANATANTNISLSGLGGGAFYLNSGCTGAPIGTTLTFTTGSSLRTIFLKNNSAGPLTLRASDPSNVITAFELPVHIAPSQFGLTGLATVVSGKCSDAYTITTAGFNGIPGPVGTNTTVGISGIAGSNASLFSDSSCSSPLDPAALVLASGSTHTLIYLKDPRAEILTLSMSDPSGTMTPSTGSLTVTIGASKIDFTTSVTSVVAGQCSPAFFVKLQDSINNDVVTTAPKTLNLLGLNGTLGAFYASPSCTGAAIGNTVVIPASSAFTVIYFKDVAAEILTLSISDPLAVLTTSEVINLMVSPSALSLEGPSPAKANTNICAGPFTVRTLDGLSAPTNAVTAITANLVGKGPGGSFYSDASCTLEINSLLFNSGQGLKNFYFIGLAPESSLNLQVNDHATILVGASLSFQLVAGKSFLGNAGRLAWFESGFAPIAARQDGAAGVNRLHMDATKQYLYVSDSSQARILKYDYLNQTYIGWIGRWNAQGGLGPTGSNINSTLNAQCGSMNSGGKAAWQTPGWCVGGISHSGQPFTTNGNFFGAWGMADDGISLYVVNRSGHSINRYNATTGEFTGWIGQVHSQAAFGSGSTTLAAAPGNSNTCATTPAGLVTPGWCFGGQNRISPANQGDGVLFEPRDVVYAETATGNFLYVTQNGAISRYNAQTGAFMGWIGQVGGTTPTLSAASDVSNTCASTPAGNLTPGWCRGGTSVNTNAGTAPGGRINIPTSLFADPANDILYVLHTDNSSTIAKYTLSTGAFQSYATSLGWVWLSGMTYDASDERFYFADWRRLIKTDANWNIFGWLGKINLANSLGGACAPNLQSGGSPLNSNDNTPGWCTGGTAKDGIDERSFHQLSTVVYDGNGRLLTGQSLSFPGIKAWDKDTGAYLGTLAFKSLANPKWSNASTVAEGHGFDDVSMFQPLGSWVDTLNGHLYSTERGAGRVKKIELATGITLGWIGGITSPPTGGMPGCIGAGIMAASPGWCLGSFFNPSYIWNSVISQNQPGLMREPHGITGDGTHLYITDTPTHRTHRFVMATGAYAGWIGQVGNSPTGGMPGCNGAPIGQPTPGWCNGGYSASGNGDGRFNSPDGIIVNGGSLYIVDRGNDRVMKYSAATGVFEGWIGAIGTAPSGGCTTASNGSGYNVSTNGWCLGGTPIPSVEGDRGGGFDFDVFQSSIINSGITTDGANLYISNGANSRIDRWTLGGVYTGSTSARSDTNYSATWTTHATTVSGYFSISMRCSTPSGLWTDGTHLFGISRNSCGTGAPAVIKINLTSGNMIGWQGAVNIAPTGGDPFCAGQSQGTATPGWCQGGRADFGYTLGTFQGARSLSGDSNYIYVSDEGTSRITRIPK